MRGIFRRRVVLVLLLASSSRLVAQSRLQRLAPDRFLRPSDDTIAVTVEARGRSVSFATAIYTLRRATLGKRAVWERSYEWHGNDGSRTADTLWIDARTLSPIENHRHNGLLDAVTRFDGPSARTRFTMKGQSEQEADTTVSGRLYASGQIEELLRSSPLATGYHAAYLLYYGPPGRAVHPASFSVVRSETIEARDGNLVECWVVDAPLSEGLNTFYLRKTDHRVVRLVNHEDPNAAFVFSR